MRVGEGGGVTIATWFAALFTLSDQLSQLGFQLRLDRPRVGLHLPARVGGSVVRQSQSKGAHHGEPIYPHHRESSNGAGRVGGSEKPNDPPGKQAGFIPS